jgi:hypothetical protein
MSWLLPIEEIGERFFAAGGIENVLLFDFDPQGSWRRSAAMASRSRVSCFSRASSCLRAASHSSRALFRVIVVFTAPFTRIRNTASFIRIRNGFCCMVLLTRHFDGERRQAAGRDRAGHDQSQGGCETEWAHRSPLRWRNFDR